MISNTAASIARAGIMFAFTGDDDRPFPSLPTSNDDRGTPGAYEFLPYDFPLESFAGWILVSVDPRGSFYGDDDAEAMDVTNWDVIEGAAAEVAHVSYYDMNDVSIAKAHEAGAMLIDRVLLVAPLDADDDDTDPFGPDTHNDRVASLVDLAKQLEDYPLLDEEAYSQRDADAWHEWADRGGLAGDTTGELADYGVDADTVDLIGECWSDVWPFAMDHVDEHRGFTGECSPKMSDAVAMAIVVNLIRVTDPPFTHYGVPFELQSR